MAAVDCANVVQRVRDFFSWGLNEEGAIYAEYTIILVLVSVLMVLALVGLGIPLYRHYEMVRSFIVFPLP